MRELIQNARDAIAARRALAQNFSGRILVKISSKSNAQTYVEIRDDGVGMSEGTMTDALLDFGTSFWASDLVRSEFPGLRSSSFRPVGKFGIGFYAVFMVASEVFVASRRFDEGVSDVTRLHFANGLTLRPILAKGADEHYDVMSSTSVRLTIDQPIGSVANRLMNEGQPQNELTIPLQNYMSAITAGLDVLVELQIAGGSPVTVHESIGGLDTPEKVFDWIQGITFVDIPSATGSADLKKYVGENVERIRSIEHEGRLLGRAALLDMYAGHLPRFLTTETIGGLNSQVIRGSGSYMGYMENYPASAKRDAAKKVAPIDVLQAWANQQVSILRERNANPEQLYWAASNIANMELDSIDVMIFPVLLQNNHYVFMTFDQIFNALHQTAFACLKSRHLEFADPNISPTVIDGLPTLRPLSTGNLIRVQIENGRPKYPESLLGCLDRLILRRGRELTYETKPTPLQAIGGPMDALLIRLKKA